MSTEPLLSQPVLTVLTLTVSLVGPVLTLPVPVLTRVGDMSASLVDHHRFLNYSSDWYQFLLLQPLVRLWGVTAPSIFLVWCCHSPDPRAQSQLPSPGPGPDSCLTPALSRTMWPWFLCSSLCVQMTWARWVRSTNFTCSGRKPIYFWTNLTAHPWMVSSAWTRLNTRLPFGHWAWSSWLPLVMPQCG